jgi:hypothetical protein
MGMNGQCHAPGALQPLGMDHWTGGWVGPRAGLETEARGKFLLPLVGMEHLSPGHPVYSQDTILSELPQLFKPK